MKSRRAFLLFPVLTFLLLGGSAVATEDYLELVPGAEKWYVEIGNTGPQAHRMHTLVRNYPGGYFKMHREFLEGEQVVLAEDCVFAKTVEGDIYYRGTLQDGLYDNPVLWVDAPLTVGKTWKDSRQIAYGAVDETIHYVFAVLEEETITCPGGMYDCFRVFLSEIHPDGTVENSSFWYNENCGLIRCALDECNVYQMVKAFINDGPRPIGDDVPHETNPDEYLVGGLMGVPNPAKPMTAISFELKQAATVSVDIYDISGRLVKTLARGEFMAAGPATIRWQGTNERGQAVASGTYLYKVRAGNTVSTNRITLVR